MEDNFFSVFIVSLFLFLGLAFVGICVGTGLTRAAAISSGMSASDYSHWVDDVR